jgi:Sec-independent protein translocase protein TatA
MRTALWLLVVGGILVVALLVIGPSKLADEATYAAVWTAVRRVVGHLMSGGH